MKQQEIILDPQILKILENNILFNLKTYNSNFNRKKLLFDKDNRGNSYLLNETKRIISSLSDTGKIIVDPIFGNFWEGNNLYFILIEKEKKYFIKNKTANLLVNLAVNSKEKIIHSENEDIKLFLKVNSLDSEIEVVSLDEFVSPPTQSRLINIDRKLHLKKNDIFNLSEFLKGYIEDVSSITITDRYLRKFSGGFRILQLILLNCKHLKKISILTDFEDEKQNIPEKYAKKEDIISMVKKTTAIEPIMKQTKNHDRTIILDNTIRIRLSSGLDFSNIHTNKVWRDEVFIDIELLNENYT